LAVGAGALCATPLIRPNRFGKRHSREISRVAILKADSYSADLEQILMDGLNLFNLDMHAT
jgi:hypothetical protein